MGLNIMLCYFISPLTSYDSTNLSCMIFYKCSNLAKDDLDTLQVWVDKENWIEFSCISYTLLIQLLHGLCTTFPQSSYDYLMWCHMFVTMTMTLGTCDACDVWHLWYNTFPHSFLYSSKEKKRNINNNLVILPSHDNKQMKMLMST